MLEMPATSCYKGGRTNYNPVAGRAFRVSKIKHNREADCKRRIGRRLRRRNWCDQPEPMFKATNIHYEHSDRIRGIAYGGIGAIHSLAQRSGLIGGIDGQLHLLRSHLPYHESDHVLNIAYNILCGGQRLEDIEIRRNDEVYLDALGALSIPDPTTAGDFCRRFRPSDVETLMDVINRTRQRIWRQQPSAFFEEAILEADWILYSGSVLDVHNDFILETRTMTAATLAANGLQAGDSATASDHDPRVADFSLRAAGTGIPDSGLAPALAHLHPAAPNPFNPATDLRFTLDRDGRVALAIYDARGRRVRTFPDAAYPAGDHALRWNGRDDTGRQVASGVYEVRLVAHLGRRTETAAAAITLVQ